MLHLDHDNITTNLQAVVTNLADSIPDASDNTNEYKKIRDNLNTAISYLNCRKDKEQGE